MQNSHFPEYWGKCHIVVVGGFRNTCKIASFLNIGKKLHLVGGFKNTHETFSPKIGCFECVMFKVAGPCVLLGCKWVELKVDLIGFHAPVCRYGDGGMNSYNRPPPHPHPHPPHHQQQQQQQYQQHQQQHYQQQQHYPDMLHRGGGGGGGLPSMLGGATDKQHPSPHPLPPHAPHPPAAEPVIR